MNRQCIVMFALGTTLCALALYGADRLLISPWVFGGLNVAGFSCFAFVIVMRRRRTSQYEKYKGVKIVFLQEKRNIWSSHISGGSRFIIKCHLLRLRTKLFRVFDLNRTPPKRSVRIRLLEHPDDRQRVNELALEGFEHMLDKMQVQPGATIISASVLNHFDRQPERLSDRIIAVQSRPQWRFRRIQRVANPLVSIIGRVIYHWHVRPGERYWRLLMPGILVWRADDPEPRLKGLRYQ